MGVIKSRTRVTELDGSPNVSATAIKFPNGTITDNGDSTATYTPGSSGQTIYDAVVAPSGGDYTDIQSAITAGKTSIFVREGTYTLSADIVFASNDTQIIGESWATIVAGGANYTISIGAYARCLVSNIQVTGSHATNAAIRSSGSDDLLINHCKISAVQGIAVTNGVRMAVQNCEVTGASGKTGISIVSSGACQCTNNFVHDFGTSTTGANVTAVSTDGQTTIIGNWISTIGGANSNVSYGIYNVTGTAVINDNLITGVNAKITSGGDVYGIYALNQLVNITGNQIRSLGTTTCNKVWGIFAGSNATVTGNIVRSFGDGTGCVSCIGIRLNSSSLANGNFISSPNPKDAGGTVLYGIHGAGGGCNITGNLFDSFTDSASITAYFIYLAAGTDSNMVTGNKWEVENSLDQAIKDDSTLSEIFDNHNSPAVFEKKYCLMKNVSGGALSAGHLVVLGSAAAGDQMTTSTTLGDSRIFGMLIEATSNGAYGLVQTWGGTTLLKVNGTNDIAIGDFISQYSTAGIGQKATPGTLVAVGDTAIAVALENYSANDSNGVIDAIIINPLKL